MGREHEVYDSEVLVCISGIIKWKPSAGGVIEAGAVCTGQEDGVDVYIGKFGSQHGEGTMGKVSRVVTFQDL